MKRAFFILYFITCSFCYAQTEMVLNSGFEQFSSYPNELAQLNKAEHWNTLYGSCEYFYDISPLPKNVEFVMTGVKAVSGNGCAGIAIMSGEKEPCGELMQGQLAGKLEKGKEYLVSAFVWYCSGCVNCIVDRMRISFSDSSFIGDKDSLTLNEKEKSRLSNSSFVYLQKPGGSFIDDTVWVKLNAKYTAEGNERFIAIGNLHQADFKWKRLTNDTRFPVRAQKENKSYCYIDNVSVKEIRKFEITDKPVVLKNIFFVTGRSDILPASEDELGALFTFLKANPSVSVEISGHTDNQGNDKANLELSEARAKAVSQYLIGKGINRSRLSWKGFGSQRPVAGNNSEQGRQLNRRVEFRIVKK